MHKLAKENIKQNLHTAHIAVEERYWANVADTAKRRAAQLRSSDFNAYLDEVLFLSQPILAVHIILLRAQFCTIGGWSVQVSKDGSKFVGKLLEVILFPSFTVLS